MRAKEQAIADATKRTEIAVKRAKEGNTRELRAIAKEHGGWDPAKGLIVYDQDNNPQFLTLQEYKNAIQNTDDAKHQLAQRLEPQLVARMTGGGLGGTQSQPGGRKPGLQIKEVIGQLASGNLGGALGELMQPLGGGTDWQQKLKKAGEAKVLEGRAAGGLSGMMRGLGGRAMAFAPMLASPAVAFGAYQAFTRASAATRATISEGQVTGGGFREGLAARGESLALAANPFDMMDRRTAQQITKGIRSRGFSGELGRALQDTVGDVFQDLGTDIEGSMDMLRDVVKGNIMTIDEFRDTMRDLDDQAKKTGLSVQTVQDNLKSIMDTAASGGGIAAAGIAMDAAEPLTDIFSNLKATQAGQLGSITAPMLRSAALMHGVPAFMALGPDIQRQQAKFYDDYTNYLWDMMQRMPPPMNTPNGLAMFLVSTQPEIIAGITDVDQAELFLKDLFKTRKSGGFQKAFVEHAKEQIERESENAMKSRRISRKGWRRFAPGIGIIADKITGDKGPVSTTGIRQSLAEIREGMSVAGVSEEKINDILRPGRQIAFSKNLDPQERSDRYEAIYDRLVEQAQREVKVTLDMRPEASRYFQGINQPNTAYISGGKNSQYVLRPPALGR